MSNTIPFLEPNLQIGDYVLHELIETRDDRQIWLGQQISVKREIELVCYYGSQGEDFLADIRIKALVEDGSLGLVYEAIPTDQFIAFAREVLPATSLQTLVDEGSNLSPLAVTQIIEQVATILKTLERKGIATDTFGPSDVRLSENNRVRLRNIAKAGAPGDETASRAAFTDSLRRLLKFGEPGATRMGTLLEYIIGTELQPAIPWSQAETLAKQVEEQLNTNLAAPPRSAPVYQQRSSRKGIMIAGAICGLLALMLGIIVFRPQKDEIRTDLVVTVPAGRYPRPNGGVVKLAGFRIDSSEVTIGEYATFMIAWQKLNKLEKSKLWPANVQGTRTAVRPQDWNEYYPLASANKSWRGRKISLDHPVIGVDWWDARAFAKWSGGRLPTEMEWWALCSSTLAATNQRTEWAPVGGAGELAYGLRGNVAEWAQQFSRDPAFPIEAPKPVLLGGSFLDDESKALSRKWLDSVTLRAENVGFRVAFPVEQ